MDFEFLKKNAEDFFENALELFRKGKFNLCAFNLEQSVQLILKYLLAKKTGDFPKTHSLKTLFESSFELCPELTKIFKRNPNTIGNLENAYISSRYLPAQFTSDELSEMIKVAKQVFRAVERCLS